MIDIKEGRGNRSEAKKYLKLLAGKDNFEIDAAEKSGMIFDNKKNVVESSAVKNVISVATPITETEKIFKDIYLKSAVFELLYLLNTAA